MEKTKQLSKQNHNNTLNILRIHTTLYQNYILLYCKGHILMISNKSNINVQTKSNTVNKITTTHLICSKFIIGYDYKMLKIYLKNCKKLQVLLLIDTQCHSKHSYGYKIYY